MQLPQKGSLGSNPNLSGFIHLFFNVLFICLNYVKTERLTPRAHSLLHSLMCEIMNWPKPGAGNLTQASQVGGRNPIFESPLLHLSVRTGRKLGSIAEPDFNYNALIWDTQVPSSILTTRSNTYPP